MSNTLDDTFNPAALAGSGTATSKNANSTAAKTTKTTQSYPRLDLEPLYGDLKSCIGHNWGTYHDALQRFIRAELSATEFGNITDEFIYSSPTTEHAHNSLICAIILNIGRDLPDPGPAPWVSATSDKTSGASSSKPAITSDAGEQRLKTEIKALTRRDRNRLKTIANDKTDEDTALAKKNGYEEFNQISKIKAPESAPTNAGGIGKTNWELEIKKRYTQPLFSEMLEFPDVSTVHARMVPICYEESVPGGASVQCAELVVTATEFYLKDFLGMIFNRTRSNGPRYENGAGGGILTAAYKRQLYKEEDDEKAGRISRNRDDELLPVESAEARNRRPLTIADFKIATRVGPNPWNGMPLLGMQVNEAPTENDYDDWREEKELNQLKPNGIFENGADSMDVDDDDDWGWDGTNSVDREAFNSLLDDCLAIRA